MTFLTRSHSTTTHITIVHSQPTERMYAIILSTTNLQESRMSAITVLSATRDHSLCRRTEKIFLDRVSAVQFMLVTHNFINLYMKAV